MIKEKSKMPYRKPEVDLTGPDGNAFVLLGMGKRWSKELCLEWEPIMNEAMKGDYDHLVATMDKYFGDYVDFIR